MNRGKSIAILGATTLSLGILGGMVLPLPLDPFTAAAVSKPSSPRSPTNPAAFHQFGHASWYEASHQAQTADGEYYDSNALAAAHRSLPFNTKVRVTNLDNGKSVVLRINDRGPYVVGRVIDVTVRAAKALGMQDDGIAPVLVETVPGQTQPADLHRSELAED